MAPPARPSPSPGRRPSLPGPRAHGRPASPAARPASTTDQPARQAQPRNRVTPRVKAARRMACVISPARRASGPGRRRREKTRRPTPSRPEPAVSHADWPPYSPASAGGCPATRRMGHPGDPRTPAAGAGDYRQHLAQRPQHGHARKPRVSRWVRARVAGVRVRPSTPATAPHPGRPRRETAAR